MKRSYLILLRLCLVLGCLVLIEATLFEVPRAMAQNIEIDSPAISAIRQAMRTRFQQLKPHLESGAIGVTPDGLAVRDANLIPLAQRASVTSMVAAQNQDAGSLYREIAAANGKPEWEKDIRNTFTQRWLGKAPPGWYVKDASGQWTQKK